MLCGCRTCWRAICLHSSCPIQPRLVHIFIFTFDLPMCAHFHSYFQSSKRQTAHVQEHRTTHGQRNMWWAVRHVVRDMWWAAQHVVGSATPSAQHPQQTLSFSHSLSHGHSLSVWNTPGQGQASSKPRPPSKCLVGVLSRPSQLRVAMGRRVAVGRRVGWWRVAIG